VFVYGVNGQVLPQHSVRTLLVVHLLACCLIELPKIMKHFPGGLVSVFTILLECLTHYVFQIRRHVVAMRTQTRRFIIEKSAKHFRLIVAAKGSLACDHLEEQDAQ